MEQFANGPSLRFLADFCPNSEDVWTAMSAAEDSLFCTVEMDTLLSLLLSVGVGDCFSGCSVVSSSTYCWRSENKRALPPCRSMFQLRRWQPPPAFTCSLFTPHHHTARCRLAPHRCWCWPLLTERKDGSRRSVGRPAGHAVCWCCLCLPAFWCPSHCITVSTCVMDCPKRPVSEIYLLCVELVVKLITTCFLA